MTKFLFMKLLLYILHFCIALQAAGQQLPAFKSLRFDEDYRILKQDSNRNAYREFKYKPLSKGGPSFLSLGGEIRYQYLRFNDENWGAAAKDKDGYILTRYLLHADLHLGTRIRTFVQLQSSLANGLEEDPSPVDENLLDLHQAFVDASLLKNTKKHLFLRIGRQELMYGSQRLVAVRDGPNNRQSFDAAKLMYNVGSWKADLFYSHYVRARPTIFDDRSDRNTQFWGSYFVKNKVPVIKNIDLYYFGLRRKKALFDDGPGKELRHSVGSRIWSNKAAWRYDIEGLYQFGSLSSKDISAWTFSINTGYKFKTLLLQPELGLKTELISGDAQYGDNKLQSFNPLFPRGSYFGLVSLIGPANLVDVHPSLSLELSKIVSLNFDGDVFWRYSNNDGIYGPNVALLYSGKNSTAAYIGTQLSADLVYTPGTFLYFRAEITWFKAGNYLKQVSPGKNIACAALTAQLKF